MQGRLLLDVVVGQGSSVLELLSREDQTLLVRWDSLLVLDLSLHVLDSIGALDLKRDGLSRQGLDKDLHTATETQHQVQGAFLLDVVVRQGTAILQLLTGEDKTSAPHI